MPLHTSLSGKLRANRRPVFVKEKRSARFWKFLNSSFALWMLSTMFISFGSWSYTVWADGRKRESYKQEQIKKLDTEISSRFYYKEVDLWSINVGIRRFEKFPITSSDRRKIYDEILSPPPAQRIIFPEYASRGLLSLLEELSGLLEGQDQLCVQSAISTVRVSMLRMEGKTYRADTVGSALKWVKKVADFRWSKDAQKGKFRYQMLVKSSAAMPPLGCPTDYLAQRNE